MRESNNRESSNQESLEDIQDVLTRHYAECNIDRMKTFLKALIDLKEPANRVDSYGICYNVVFLYCTCDDEFSSEQHFAETLVKHLCKHWPESVSSLYPILVNDSNNGANISKDADAFKLIEAAQAQYEDAVNNETLWDTRTEYARKRFELLDWMIASLEVFIASQE